MQLPIDSTWFASMTTAALPMTSNDYHRSHHPASQPWIVEPAFRAPAGDELVETTGGTFDSIEWSISLNELLELEREIIRNYTELGEGDHASDLDPLTRSAVRALVIAIFVVVIAIGVVANSTVLYVIIAGRRMRTVTNVFIGNLAVSDLWMCAVSLPVQLHYQLTERWVFGPTLCRVVFAAFAVPMYSSILSILWIAVDRYRLIVCPLRRRWSTEIALGMIGLSVLISLIVSTPVIRYTSLHIVDDEELKIHKSFCIELWPSTFSRRIYSLGVFLVQFCLPLVVTAILYERLYASLRRRRSARLHGASINHRCRQHQPQPASFERGRLAKHIQVDRTRSSRCCGRVCRHAGSLRVFCPMNRRRNPDHPSINVSETVNGGTDSAASKDPSTSTARVRVDGTNWAAVNQSRNNGAASVTSALRRRRRGGRKTSRLLFAIVANFVACWLPWNIFSLIVELDRTAVRGSLVRIIDLGLKIFALAGSACVNPFFYCWFNDNFRVELSGLIASVPFGIIRSRYRSRTDADGQCAAAEASRRSRPHFDVVGMAQFPIAGDHLKPAVTGCVVAADDDVERRSNIDVCRVHRSNDHEEADDRRRESSSDGRPITTRRDNRRHRQRIQHQRSSSFRTTTTTTVSTTGSIFFRPRGLSRSFSVTDVHQIIGNVV